MLRCRCFERCCWCCCCCCFHGRGLNSLLIKSEDVLLLLIFVSVANNLFLLFYCWKKKQFCNFLIFCCFVAGLCFDTGSGSDIRIPLSGPRSRPNKRNNSGFKNVDFNVASIVSTSSSASKLFLLDCQVQCCSMSFQWMPPTRRSLQKTLTFNDSRLNETQINHRLIGD